MFEKLLRVNLKVLIIRKKNSVTMYSSECCDLLWWCILPNLYTNIKSCCTAEANVVCQFVTQFGFFFENYNVVTISHSLEWKNRGAEA